MKTRAILALVMVSAATLLVAQTPPQVDAVAETQIAQEINDLRKKEGLKPLKVDVRLGQVARNHSTLLAKHKELKDQFPEEANLKDRVDATGMKKVDSGGENSGQNVDLTKVNQMFMDSATHRANLMNPDFNAVGIGVVNDGQTNWVTQVFVKTRSDIQEAK